MFDRIIDFILQVAHKLKPWVVINHYDRGVRLRFGKPKGELQPGFHWIVPLGIDNILTHMIKTSTIDLAEQTITTKDNQSVVVKAVIKYEVKDVLKLLLEVNGPVDAVADMGKGIIRKMLVERDWNECNDADLEKKIASKVRNEAKKWGIEVLDVTLTDLAIMQSFRILNTRPDQIDIF